MVGSINEPALRGAHAINRYHIIGLIFSLQIMYFGGNLSGPFARCRVPKETGK